MFSVLVEVGLGPTHPNSFLALVVLYVLFRAEMDALTEAIVDRSLVVGGVSTLAAVCVNIHGHFQIDSVFGRHLQGLLFTQILQYDLSVGILKVQRQNILCIDYPLALAKREPQLQEILFLLRSCALSHNTKDLMDHRGLAIYLCGHDFV